MGREKQRRRDVGRRRLNTADRELDQEREPISEDVLDQLQEAAEKEAETLAAAAYEGMGA